MTHEYPPSEWLPLSGIQHFFFCRRQWALIHVERQWQENVLTVEGKLLHTRVDDPFFTEKRKDVIVTRSVPVASPTLGTDPGDHSRSRRRSCLPLRSQATRNGASDDCVR